MQMPDMIEAFSRARRRRRRGKKTHQSAGKQMTNNRKTITVTDNERIYALPAACAR